ncbi:Aep2p SCDLUD_001261 [Saccharomycodes ludwigii]|uniref:Aep2p n=1 Tax=Saccharomycodes ludwigii TaxID=36035 RepID=UPI001E8C4E7C|nr:hypothetical protein SCDLUD_001261 [Saccharomycodes ludwigii]KAH3903616.1 hypothetical protein SCDLUD_001261 [Saccharomycodes ludwigii]
MRSGIPHIKKLYSTFSLDLVEPVQNTVIAAANGNNIHTPNFIANTSITLGNENNSGTMVMTNKKSNNVVTLKAELLNVQENLNVLKKNFKFLQDFQPNASSSMPALLTSSKQNFHASNINSYFDKQLLKMYYNDSTTLPSINKHEFPSIIHYGISIEKDFGNLDKLWIYLQNTESLYENKELYMWDALKLLEKNLTLGRFTQSSKIFHYLLDHNYNGEIPLYNAKFLTIYLKLKAGTLIKYTWVSTAGFLNGENEYTSRIVTKCRKNQKKMKIWKYEYDRALKYVNTYYLNDLENWKTNRTLELETNILYMFANLKPASASKALLDRYIKETWFNEELPILANSNIAPNSYLLISIVKSFTHIGDFRKGMEYIDLFLTKYGNNMLTLDSPFWFQLFNLSEEIYNSGMDKEGLIAMNIWDLLINYSGKNKELDIHFPLYGLLPYYNILKQTNNIKKLSEFYFEIFKRGHKFVVGYNNNNDSLRKLFIKCQKVLICKSLYRNQIKSQAFIKNFSIDADNKKELTEYFKTCRDKELKRRKGKIEKDKRLQAKYDREEEEDKLLGELW